MSCPYAKPMWKSSVGGYDVMDVGIGVATAYAIQNWGKQTLPVSALAGFLVVTGLHATMGKPDLVLSSVGYSSSSMDGMVEKPPKASSCGCDSKKYS